VPSRYRMRELPPDRMAPVLPFDDFMSYVIGPGAAGEWKQDQHVGLIGPTESGKSTLTYTMLDLRRYTTLFGTKIRDETLDKYATKGGYERISSWPPMTRGRGLRRRPATAEEMPRRLLWPEVHSIDPTSPDGLRLMVAQQRREFAPAIADIYTSGGWCVVWDEFWMMTHILNLEDEARIFLQQARSNKISFVMGAQRPSRIPLELFDQSTHLFFWRDNDERNLKTIGGIGWLASEPIRAFVANLEQYQFLYIHTRKGWMYRSTAPELK